MKMLFVADLHYTLKQLDWLVANAGDYDLVVIGGDLLDLGSDLDFDVQIVVVERYRTDHRAEDFFVDNFHPGTRSSENCRFHKIALVAQSVAAHHRFNPIEKPRAPRFSCL